MSSSQDRFESEEGAGALLFVLLACVIAAALVVFAVFHIRLRHRKPAPDQGPVAAGTVATNTPPMP